MKYAVFLNNKWYLHFGMPKMPQMFTIAHACKKIKITPKRISSRKPSSNTGDTVSAATWNTLPQVAPTPRVKWLTMATDRSSSDSDVDLDSQIDRFDDFYFVFWRQWGWCGRDWDCCCWSESAWCSTVPAWARREVSTIEAGRMECTVAVGVAVAAVELHVGVSGSLRWYILVGIAPLAFL